MSKRSSFEAGLPSMMYGYGDAKTPDPESVILVSKLVKEHLRDVLRSGVEKAVWQGMPAMDDYCVMLSVRNDPKRFAKLNHLIKMNEEIKEVKEPHQEFKSGIIEK